MEEFAFIPRNNVMKSLNVSINNTENNLSTEEILFLEDQEKKIIFGKIG